MRPELEVALLGHTADTDEWAAMLSGRGHRVARLDSPASLAGQTVELVLIAVATPDEAPAALRLLGEAPAAPALALLAGDPHPLTRLVRAVLQAKRDWEAPSTRWSIPWRSWTGEGS
jgi:hypothetical protein